MKIIHKSSTAAKRSASVVHVNPMRLVMLLLIHVEPAIGIGMALCSSGAIVHDRGSDVWEMVKENFI
jgi:hypothetical protein